MRGEGERERRRALGVTGRRERGGKGGAIESQTKNKITRNTSLGEREREIESGVEGDLPRREAKPRGKWGRLLLPLPVRYALCTKIMLSDTLASVVWE